jgi:hypothetical protein
VVINCDACVKAKATQLPFPVNKKTASELLALVYSDLLNCSKLTPGVVLLGEVV